MLLRLLPCLLLLSAIGLAQSGSEGEEAERIRAKRAALQEAGDLKEEEGKGTPDDALSELTPEQRLNASMRHGAGNFCTFIATPKPSRLMPGQSGVVVVTAVLRSRAVLQAPAPVELTSTPNQGLVTLAGQPQFRPAEPGRIESAYRGKPVYDNYAIFEVPVTMSAQAQLGQKQVVSLELKFDLFDGSTAQSIGRFLDRCSTEIEVGRAADPAVNASNRARQGLGQQRPTGGAAVTDGSADAELAEARPAPKSTVVVAAPNLVLPDQQQPSASAPASPSSDAPPVDEEPLLPMPLWIAGGALVGLLALLLLRRR